MGKYSRSVTGICDNDMQYPELYKKHSNMDGDIIMHKLLKEGAVKAAGTNVRVRFNFLKVIREFSQRKQTWVTMVGQEINFFCSISPTFLSNWKTSDLYTCCIRRLL